MKDDGYTIEKGMGRVRDRRKLGCGYTTRPVPVWIVTTPEGYHYNYRLKREAEAQVARLKAKNSSKETVSELAKSLQELMGNANGIVILATDPDPMICSRGDAARSELLRKAFTRRMLIEFGLCVDFEGDDTIVRRTVRPCTECGEDVKRGEEGGEAWAWDESTGREGALEAVCKKCRAEHDYRHETGM